MGVRLNLSSPQKEEKEISATQNQEYTVSAMRASLLLLAVLVVLASSQASSISEVLVKEQWEAWKAKNGKEYQNHEEERFRMKIWMDNLEKMEKHNEQYYQGEVKGLKRLNKFSDLLESEIEAASAGTPNAPRTVPRRAWTRRRRKLPPSSLTS